ncbi:MAG TPA: hypothetical protein VNH11_05345 [Pirellulales bacterium]|nr:hypothetical protein [Pirellulales bacterium]
MAVQGLPSEPLYTGRPHYCVSAFGPSPRSHVWLALDDDHLYVDRWASSDLTAETVVSFPDWRSGDVMSRRFTIPCRVRAT